MRPDRSGPVAGVVLAAGASVRMGANKLLFEIEGEVLVHRAVRRASAAGLNPVIVVLGHEAERVRLTLADLRCQAVVNPAYARGVHESLRVGIGAVPPDALAAVVMLADMPFVTSAMIETLVERFRGGDAPLVVSEYGHVNAPPVLYGRALFDELRAVDGEGCGKRVVQRHSHEAMTVSWPEEALSDLDVPEDVDRLQAKAAEP